MGTPFCELWVKPRDAAAVKALSDDGYDVAKPKAWVKLWEHDQESDAMGSLGWDSFCPDDVKPHGEVVYLAMGDSKAKKTKHGLFFYEHVIDGKVTRGLALDAGKDGVLRWQRVDGAPEAWEKPFGKLVKGEEKPAPGEEKLFGAAFDGLTPKA